MLFGATESCLLLRGQGAERGQPPGVARRPGRQGRVRRRLPREDLGRLARVPRAPAWRMPAAAGAHLLGTQKQGLLLVLQGADYAFLSGAHTFKHIAGSNECTNWWLDTRQCSG